MLVKHNFYSYVTRNHLAMHLCNLTFSCVLFKGIIKLFSLLGVECKQTT